MGGLKSNLSIVPARDFSRCWLQPLRASNFVSRWHERDDTEDGNDNENDNDNDDDNNNENENCAAELQAIGY